MPFIRVDAEDVEEDDSYWRSDEVYDGLAAQQRNFEYEFISGVVFDPAEFGAVSQ